MHWGGNCSGGPFTLKYGYMAAVCPSGYVISGCVVHYTYDCSSGDNSATCGSEGVPVFNSNTNPTQCAGTFNSYDTSRNYYGTALCAKVCN